MKLRQAALDSAREIWADYLLVRYHLVLLMLHFCPQGKVITLDGDDNVNDSWYVEMFLCVGMNIYKILQKKRRQNCLIDHSLRHNYII